MSLLGDWIDAASADNEPLCFFNPLLLVYFISCCNKAAAVKKQFVIVVCRIRCGLKCVRINCALICTPFFTSVYVCLVNPALSPIHGARDRGAKLLNESFVASV